MEQNKKYIIYTRIVRAVLFFSLLCLFSYILFMCSKIHVNHMSIELTDEKSREVYISERNPNALSSFFLLRDLSKEEYVYQINKNNNSIKGISFGLRYDKNAQETFALSNSFSGIDGGFEAGFNEILFVWPTSEKVNFYTKNIVAENLQMIRSFFLTEIILFLFALFLRELYQLQRVVLLRKSVSKKILYSKQYAFRGVMFTSIMSLVLIVVLYFINIVPENIINVESFKQESSSCVFAMHDISCTYQHFIIPSTDRTRESIQWEANEIVEFKPEELVKFNCKSGAKRIDFSQISLDVPIDIRFLTKNLQSANYQEIRLFVVTTLLLFFLERCFVYMRRWVKLKE